MYKTPLTYLALGDSYTVGHQVRRSESFPFLLSEALKKENILLAPPEIIAVNGWTTSDLKQGIAGAKIQRSYHLVSLLIGANNHYQKRSLEEYKKEFRELLLAAIQFAGENSDKVFVLSIPDYGFTPFGKADQENISAGIRTFNKVNKDIADMVGATYIDLTEISRRGLCDASLLTEDGLHPSGKMYQQWVDVMLKDVIQLIIKP